jgi:hypothetical protein
MTAPDAAQGTADVYITNAHPCSAGTGPGYATLPWPRRRPWLTRATPSSAPARHWVPKAATGR